MTQAELAPSEERGAFFSDPAMAANPYPFFKMLRENAPVVKFGGVLGLWVVSRYDDVCRILRDHETFSSRVDATSMRGEERPPSILFDDPPVHTRMRGLISKAFTPKVIGEQRPAIQKWCDDLVDKMCAKEEADIVKELAYPLPVTVIAHMLGVQDGDLATFKRWSDAIIQNIGNVLAGDDSGLLQVNEEFNAYFTEQINRLRERPEPNLLSELIHAETDAGRLSMDDLRLVCRVLLVAGNETTTGLIINAVRAFAEFPDEMARVKGDPSLVPDAVEEAVRFYSPFPGTFRRATRDVDIAGVTIPAGERVVPLLASANRDETQFDDPDRFIVGREPNRHVAFGLGIHYCLGAPLARLEGDIAITTLLRRIKRVEVTESEPGNFIRPGGPESLRVRFELDREAAPA